MEQDNSQQMDDKKQCINMGISQQTTVYAKAVCFLMKIDGM